VADGEAVQERADALARAIVRAFHVPGRGYDGNRFVWESENHLRRYLTEGCKVVPQAEGVRATHAGSQQAHKLCSQAVGTAERLTVPLATR
jgi:hypothetical protein